MTIVNYYNMTKFEIYKYGIERILEFCDANKIIFPQFLPCEKKGWDFDAVAYYRPYYIKICIEKCSNLSGFTRSRNWNWPGSTTDKTPYGVLAHELGHHIDYIFSDQKGKYFGDFSKKLCDKTGEKPISGYNPNHAEWFAEIFRLFTTNHALLKILRPNTYKELEILFKPISNLDWKIALGDAPLHILQNLENKINKL